MGNVNTLLESEFSGFNARTFDPINRIYRNGMVKITQNFALPLDI
jgi:hypothetical protein